jgi:hypothetical protein
MRSAHARIVALLFFACGLATCSDSPMSAGRFGVANLSLAVAYPESRSLSAADLTVDNVDVVVLGPNESQVLELNVPFPAADSQITIDVRVPLDAPQETFFIELQLRSGTLPLYTGAQSVGVQRGVLTAPVTVDVSYIGPSALAIVAGDMQTTALGSAVGIPPSVRVTSKTGSPVPGVAVNFTPTAGGGSVTGGVQTTDANGIATVGSWVLGGTSSAQTLTATLGTITATFHATSTTTLTLSGAGTGNGTVVSTPAGINCSVTSGSIKGACSATFGAATSVTLTQSAVPQSGNVFGGWSGACTGSANCVIPSTTATSVVTASFNFDVCFLALPIAVGSTASGSIANSDCQFATGQFADFYSFSVSSQQLLTASLTLTVVPELLVFLTPGTFWFSTSPAGATSTAQVLALPAGSYELGATNASANTFGSYRLTLAPLQALAGCNNTRTTFGLTALPATLGQDCAYTIGDSAATFADGFSIFVPSTKTLRVTVASAAFQPVIEFRDGNSDTSLGTLLKSSAGTTGGTVSLSMTGGGFVRVWVTQNSARAAFGGAYTITVDP